MSIKPARYCLYTEAELDALGTRVDQVLAAWAREWLAGFTCAIDVCTPLTDLAIGNDDERWVIANRGDGPLMLAVRSAPTWVQDVSMLLTGLSSDTTGGNVASSISQRLAETLLRSFTTALLSGTGPAIDPASVSWGDRLPALQEISWPGSGWIMLSCQPGPAGSLLFLLSPDLAAAFIGIERQRHKSEPTGTVPIRRAIEQNSVTLDVIAGNAELTLSDLQTLQVGDVVRLDRKLHELLRIGVVDGESVCSGHLGAVKGSKAVQLLFVE